MHHQRGFQSCNSHTSKHSIGQKPSQTSQKAVVQRRSKVLSTQHDSDTPEFNLEPIDVGLLSSWELNPPNLAS